jgi:hypothetical protein
MTDLPTSDISFDGVGATAGSAEEASRVLAARLNHWLADHPNCRILDFSVQSTSSGTQVQLTAILAFLEESAITEALSTAEASAAAVVEAEQIVGGEGRNGPEDGTPLP